MLKEREDNEALPRETRSAIKRKEDSAADMRCLEDLHRNLHRESSDDDKEGVPFDHTALGLFSADGGCRRLKADGAKRHREAQDRQERERKAKMRKTHKAGMDGGGSVARGRKTAKKPRK